MTSILMSRTGPRPSRRGAMIAGAALLVASATAAADISPVIFHIQATTATGTDTWMATVDQGEFGPGGTYSWTLADDIELRSQTGELLGTLSSATTFIIEDPVVSIGFAVQAGAADTVFTITSALLGFPAINPAEGRATGSITGTDTTGDGFNIAGQHGTAMVTAQYNGLAPGGTVFANLLTLPLSSPTPFDSDSANEASPFMGFAPIAGTVNDISLQYSFSLTAGDIASGTGVFVVVPGPGAAGVLGLIGLVAMRRRR
jgi:hypothetical protein